MSAKIPEDLKDLLEGPIYVALSTVSPDGQPQTTVVWCDYDGTHVRINTARGRLKEKNMSANPKVSLLAVDPEDPYRWIEVRGTVELTEEGAVEHIHSLSKLYTGKRYFGEFAPAEKEYKQTRVIGKITPTRVVSYDSR